MFERRLPVGHRAEEAATQPIDAQRAGARPGEAVLVTNLTIRTKL